MFKVHLYLTHLNLYKIKIINVSFLCRIRDDCDTGFSDLVFLVDEGLDPGPPDLTGDHPGHDAAGGSALRDQTCHNDIRSKL